MKLEEKLLERSNDNVPEEVVQALLDQAERIGSPLTWVQAERLALEIFCGDSKAHGKSDPGSNKG